jgi:hypothetical protein
MRRARWVLLAIVVVAVAIAVVFFSLPPPPGSGITPAGVRSIGPGMTRAEVEARLGGPPGEYSRDVVVEALPEELVVKHARTGSGYHWVGRRAAVFVTFDAEGRVIASYPLDVQPLGERWWWE